MAKKESKNENKIKKHFFKDFKAELKKVIWPTPKQLVNNTIEALEFRAEKEEAFYNVPLKDLPIKKDCLVACIIRDNKVIIPDGSTTIKLNDNIIVVTTHQDFDSLDDILE